LGRPAKVWPQEKEGNESKAGLLLNGKRESRHREAPLEKKRALERKEGKNLKGWGSPAW